MNFDHSSIMDDPYQHFLTSMSRVGPGPQAIAEYPTTQGQAFLHVGVSGEPAHFSEPPITGHPQDAQESVALDGSKSKGRKKSTVANPGDVVKHRRTRSGCFTCRSRRVKCDENRPVCQRCQKGNRECVYPEPAPPKKSASRSSRSKDASQTSPLSSTGDQEDGGDTSTRLQTIIDQEEPEDDKEATYSNLRSNSAATFSAVSASSGRHGSETPSQDDNRSSPSSSTAASSGFAIVPYDPSDFPLPSEGLPDLSHLPSDYQYYLRWYDDNMTHFHYGINHDTDEFFKTILPRTALINEALLNALVGFTAYQTTIQNPDGKIQDFLGYYNKSVTLLLGFLRKKDRHDVSTLMTILQLAQIEEQLGDWVNIMGHQKAALEIFTKIFTPQTVMQTPLGRMCLSWFMRFDGFVAFRGSFPNGLPKDYVDTMREYYRSQMAERPGDLNWIIADRCAHIRQISWHQALLYARRNRGQISSSDFAAEHKRIADALVDYKNNWDPAITDPKYLVTDFGGREPHPDDIVNPYEPGILYDLPLFSSTVAAADWHGVMILHMLVTPDRTKEEMFPGLQRHAFAICRCYETIQYWPHAPKGAILQQHPLLQAAYMFLPRDKKHEMWIRRKSAYGESLGHMCPLPSRERMASYFRDPSCVRWWLPNDEGFTPILQSLREFADQRNAVAVTAQQESVREATYLYQKMSEMDLGDSPGDDQGKT